MKRLFCLLTSLLILFFALNPHAIAASGNTIVYVTDTGSKYHVSSCPYLRESKHAITLENAVKHGYERCSVCRPPSFDNDPTPAPSPVPSDPEETPSDLSWKKGDVVGMARSVALVGAGYGLSKILQRRKD